MQFYNLKKRSHVDVPDSAVKKTKIVRETKSGEQIRYAFKAEFEGDTLFKFVSKAVFDSTSVPEIS
ncbi:MAG: hypothetical protein MH204_02830 [Fimbriimonadaceae bacterium]|nr:hypothetical protein [Fimbriimonadaceae bacterium]